MTDPTIPLDGATAPAAASAPLVDEPSAEENLVAGTGHDDIDLDAIERDLDDVERALGQMADGTYFDSGAAAAGDAAR